jgi:hypothetical protein
VGQASGGASCDIRFVSFPILCVELLGYEPRIGPIVRVGPNEVGAFSSDSGEVLIVGTSYTSAMPAPTGKFIIQGLVSIKIVSCTAFSVVFPQFLPPLIPRKQQ